MSQLPLVIVNPTSAGGATGAVWARTASDLRAHFGAFNCVFTERRSDGRRLAFEAARAGRKLIIACGGDGTISEAANGIVESSCEAELGILPSGTGGDFRRTLNTPTRTADAARSLREGTTRKIDVVRVTHHDHEAEEVVRYSINVASFGMSERVVERVKRKGSGWLGSNNSHLLGGRASFADAALRAALVFEKPMVRVAVDEQRERQFTLTNLCIANARYFGGGMKIAPEAKLTDGLLDVVHIGDLSKLTILANAYRLYLGTHLGMQQVHHTRAQRITAQAVDANVKVKIEVDGELIGSLPATFEIVPRALRIRTPAVD
ncbi:MAG: diacylglycerol kinase family protein [Pyrinomonadaceae bacterium]